MQGNFFSETGYQQNHMRLLLFFATSILLAAPVPPAHTVKPFGEEFPSLDSLAVGAWWEPRPAAKSKKKAAASLDGGIGCAAFDFDHQHRTEEHHDEGHAG